MQIMAEICQNRPAGINWFFRRPFVAQIKICWTKESYLTYWGIRKLSAQSDLQRFLTNFYSGAQKSISG